MKTEIRAVTAVRPEIRKKDGSSVGTLRGYAAVFDSRVDIGGMFFEQIARGAFSASLENDDVRALFDHESGRLLGRKSAGTLRLEEDDRGLAVEIDLPDTSDGRDVAALVERGDLDGMSFGFIVRHDEWDETSDPPARTIHAVDLLEVSAVTFPAYPDTELGMRSLEQAKKEKAKRDKGEDEKQQASAAYFRRKAEQEQKFRRIK